MRPRYSIRTLFLVTLGVGIVCAPIAWLQRLRLTHDIVDEAHWPSELRELLLDLRNSGAPVKNVDVRYAGLITTFCWTMPATDQAIAEHIKRFDLKSVTTNGIEIQRIHDRFPLAWTWPAHDDIECFAFPAGLPGAKEGEFEFVLLHDKTANRLFFYYYFNF